MRKSTPWKKRILFFVFSLFIFINLLAIIHAYSFTHFSATAKKKVKPELLSTSEKLAILFTGLNNPRPVNDSLPNVPYKTVMLQSNVMLECWDLPVDSAKGTILLFHGYTGSKTQMLDKAAEFGHMGYNCFVIDFMGSGGSEGNTCTVGVKEAQEVRDAMAYIAARGEKNIYLFGTSMGAVAIMKAINDYQIKPKGIIIECPFGTMYQTVCARFNAMHVPTFPMAGLLMFWGGVENGFLAFSHNPQEYATNINCPTLLLYGDKDARVSQAETRRIYENLQGEKKLIIFSGAGHENYLLKYKPGWVLATSAFLNSISHSRPKSLKGL